MCDEVHEHGALAGVELHHSGAHCPRREYRLPAIAPSQLASDYLLVTPKAMERDDIKRVQADWAAAAPGREAGFDIVYVYGAHSYLPMQFLSPFYNRRTDEYGGSLENRARFWLELLELTREASTVGARSRRASPSRAQPVRRRPGRGPRVRPPGRPPRRPLGRGHRLGDGVVEGLGRLALLQAGLAARMDEARPRGDGEADRRRLALTDPDDGRDRLERRLGRDRRRAAVDRRPVPSAQDRGRPARRDPRVHRLQHLHPEVRSGGNIGCTQNATAGEEFRAAGTQAFEPAENRDRDVLVVGAGPSGMECAIVLGKRGFRRVHLVDAENDIGGIMRWIPQLPGRGEWGRVLNWRRIQLEKLRNVEVLTGLRLDPGVREYGAELVVVATGAFWSPVGSTARRTSRSPARTPRSRTSSRPSRSWWRGRRRPGSGSSSTTPTGTSWAPTSRRAGSRRVRVDFVTSLEDISPFSHETLEQVFPQGAAARGGVRMHRTVTLERVEPGGITCADEFGEPLELEADAVVLVTQRSLGRRALPRAPRGRGAVGGGRHRGRLPDRRLRGAQLIADAIFDGHRLAREIDSENPAVPLPFVRERPVTALV